MARLSPPSFFLPARFLSSPTTESLEQANCSPEMFSTTHRKWDEWIIQSVFDSHYAFAHGKALHSIPVNYQNCLEDP